MAREAVRADGAERRPRHRLLQTAAGACGRTRRAGRNVKNALALAHRRYRRAVRRRRPRVRRRRLGARPAARRGSKDIDVEVFGIPAAELSRLLATLGRVEPAARAFPCKVVRPGPASLPSTSRCRGASETRARTQGVRRAGRPVDDAGQAARRRDFTINAISWDPLTGEYEDPFGGLAISSAASFARSTCARSATTASAC